MKQLYRTYINKQLYYTHATNTLTALRNLRKQALAKYGRYTIIQLEIRETLTNGNYKWTKIQLTTKLLQQSCGHS